MTHRFHSRLFVLWILAALAATAASATHLTHSIVFDSRDDEGRYGEGVARTILGRLDADGKPTSTSLESADGTMKAFDMRTNNNAVDGSFNELGNDGTWTIATHGNPGLIKIYGQNVKGFGTEGTGAACGDAAIRLFDGARTGLTVNLAVCFGDKAPDGGRSVARTLKDEVVARGGSVATMRAIDESVDIQAFKNWTATRRPSGITNAEATALTAALGRDYARYPMLAEYDSLQAALDRAAKPDAEGKRVKAIFLYRIKIGTLVTLGATFPGGVFAVAAPPGEPEDGIPVIDTLHPCEGTCSVAIREESWSGIKSLYRQ